VPWRPGTDRGANQARLPSPTACPTTTFQSIMHRLSRNAPASKFKLNAKMGLLFDATTMLSTYAGLLFCTFALACSLFYLAELAEEFSVLTKRILTYTACAIGALHVLFLLFENRLPADRLFVSLLCTAAYASLLPKFPNVVVTSPPFICSVGTARDLLCTPCLHAHRASHAVQPSTKRVDFRFLL
jgi:hypothetical protein